MGVLTFNDLRRYDRHGMGQLYGPVGAVATTPVQVFKIDGGERGTDQTVAHMIRLILSQWGAHNPSVVMTARKIVQQSGQRGKDYAGEIAAIHSWVQRNVRYTQDPRGLEWLQTAVYTLEHKSEGSDCDDHTILNCSLALALGHGAAIRVVKTDPQRTDEFSHVYAMAGVRTPQGVRWIAMDTTQPHPAGWEPGRIFGHKTYVVAQP